MFTSLGDLTLTYHAETDRWHRVNPAWPAVILVADELLDRWSAVVDEKAREQVTVRGHIDPGSASGIVSFVWDSVTFTTPEGQATYALSQSGGDHYARNRWRGTLEAAR